MNSLNLFSKISTIIFLLYKIQSILDTFLSI